MLLLLLLFPRLPGHLQLLRYVLCQLPQRLQLLLHVVVLLLCKYPACPLLVCLLAGCLACSLCLLQLLLQLILF
jgi:hypothetical protein